MTHGIKMTNYTARMWVTPFLQKSGIFVQQSQRVLFRSPSEMSAQKVVSKFYISAALFYSLTSWLDISIFPGYLYVFLKDSNLSCGLKSNATGKGE